jgi:predicted HicB family RNase H-like nuclease
MSKKGEPAMTAQKIEKEMLALRIDRRLKKKLFDAAWEKRITLTQLVQTILESAFPKKKVKTAAE